MLFTSWKNEIFTKKNEVPIAVGNADGIELTLMGVPLIGTFTILPKAISLVLVAKSKCSTAEEKLRCVAPPGPCIC